MKIRIFHAGKGDCILITGADDKTHILVDGGVPATYEDHLAGPLGYMRSRGKDLDVLYVSHIDRDHIGGVLELLDNEVAWRVHEFREQQDVRSNPRPELRRPCEVKSIWHNAFFEEAGLNTPGIVNTLTHAGTALAAHHDAEVLALAEQLHGIGLSVGDAIEVSRRIGKDQLDIPLNPQFQGKFMLRGSDPKTFKVGSVNARILGPTPAALKELIEEWNEWLGDKAIHLARLIKRHERDADDLQSSDLDGILETLALRAQGIAAARKDVTPPNLASLMFLFEEDGKRAMFTGDGAWEDVVDGLDAHGLLDQEGNVHVDLLKVPHHGAHNSYSDEFARRVTADHYVFCGNGEHHNPEPEVVEGYIRARRGSDAERTTNATANGRTFKLWFNCSERDADEDHKQFWRDMEDLVDREADKDVKPRMRSRFLKGRSMTRTL